MATLKNFMVFAVVTVCSLLLLESIVEARGGRGGGGGGGRGGGSRGGSRFGGSRSSGSRYSRTSRTTSSVRTSSGFRVGGLRWKAAAAVGFVYGYTRYSTRRSYRMHPDREPSICVNKYDYKRENGTYFSYFICPKYNQPDSYTYCCGPNDRQHCCSFWQGSGRAAGTIIGILLFLLTCICCCYCCCCKKKGDEPTRFESFKQRTWKGDSISGHYKATSTTDACATPMSNIYPPSQPNGYDDIPHNHNKQPEPNYPVNPVIPGGGYPPGPAPPAYDGAYPPQPGYAPQPDAAYPPMNPGYPPQPGYPGAAPGAGGPGYPQGPGDGSMPYSIDPSYPGGPPNPGAPPPGMPYPMDPSQMPYPAGGPPNPGAPPPGMPYPMDPSQMPYPAGGPPNPGAPPPGMPYPVEPHGPYPGAPPPGYAAATQPHP